MAKSAELKDRIVAKIKQEWVDRDAGGDWKEGVTDEIFVRLCKVKGWKRTYKGRNTVGDQEFVIRIFAFNGGEEFEGIIEAMVTCDTNDNFLDIEFQQQ